MKARLIQEIGTRAWLRIYWGECPGRGCHNAMRFLRDSLQVSDWGFAGEPKDYSDPVLWPTHCEDCGAPVPEGFFLNTVYGSPDDKRPIYQVHTKRLYDTTSGKPEPGDLYWAAWHHLPDWRSFCRWDNCDDPRGHLMGVLPNGREWDIDSRASNCTMPKDRLHRCWVRHGEPPEITVDKAGLTCQAGAGSIMVDGWHGFLRAGVWVRC